MSTANSDNINRKAYSKGHLSNRQYYLFSFSASSSLFSKRLSNYLSMEFYIKLDILPLSSAGITIELQGQSINISNARDALTKLLGSLKTKIYSDSKDC